jgi:hypothetical protein
MCCDHLPDFQAANYFAREKLQEIRQMQRKVMQFQHRLRNRDYILWFG